MQRKNTYTDWVQLIFRIAISTTLFSAVADRFGYWDSRSVWGNWTNFEAYTAQLLFFLPRSLANIAAIAATALEIAFGILLLIGYKTQPVAFLTGTLLALFGLSMTFALGVKPPLDYSVWAGASGCYLLAGLNHYKFSIDYLKNRKWKKD